MFCDSPLQAADEQDEPPVDRVAPFQLNEHQALGRLRDHIDAQWFVPDALRRLRRPGELKPVLVPFYVFDATARSRFSCRVGCDWYRTETYTTVDSKGRVTVRTRQVRETEYTYLEGTHGRTWKDHLVSASVGLPEPESNALEPFDVGKALPWDPALVAGLVAERPTIDAASAVGTARQELAQREASAIAAGHLPGDRHRDLRSETQSTIDAVRLILLPVWVAAFHLPGQSEALRMLVNGQTGEVVGQVPRSGWKVALAVLAAVGVFGLFLLCAASCSGLTALVEG